MSELEIIRALKDEDYRLNLTEEQRLQLPAHPAGLIELTEEDLNDVSAARAGVHPCNPTYWYDICYLK